MSSSKMTPKSDHAAVRGHPPLYFLLSLAISLAIHYWVFPLSIPFPTIGSVQGSTLRVALGIFISLIVVVFMVFTITQFRRTGNNPLPSTPAVSIITTGPYRFSRNPIYFGNALFITGIGIAVGSFWVLASVIVSLFLAYYLAILPEEKYMEEKFGDEYLEYKKAVRRWI